MRATNMGQDVGEMTPTHHAGLQLSGRGPRVDALPPVVRGACPSLAAPMETGDGLLVRLRPAAPGLGVEEWRRLAQAAARFGNGLIEVTARGNIQIRGLRRETYQHLAADIAAAGIDIQTGVAIEVPPLAGIDPFERADARSTAEALRAAIAASVPALRLAPKLAIIVDGGGQLPLDDVQADIRLMVEKGDARLWRLAVSGDAQSARPLAILPSAQIVPAVMRVLFKLHELGPRARGRDLDEAGLNTLFPQTVRIEAGSKSAPSPVGIHDLDAGRIAVGLRLGFCQIRSEDLIGFLDTAAGLGADEIRTAQDHTLLLLGIGRGDVAALEEVALRHGLNLRPEALSNRLVSCAGAGACASALCNTRDVAGAVGGSAPSLLDRSMTVHLSGCAKGCARAAPAPLAIVGTSTGYGLVVNGRASDVPVAYINEENLKSALGSLAGFVAEHKDAGESVSACLTRLGTHAIAEALRQG